VIEHTRDFRRVKRFVDCPIVISSDCYYLMESSHGVDSGVWFFGPFEDALIVHVAMALNCRGRAAMRSGEDAFGWIWGNTGVPAIYAFIEHERPDVKALARALGFQNAPRRHTPTGVYYRLQNPYVMQREAVAV